ncbi:MAG: hypothetical protein E7287_00820 [Lachnospiraceae bacterium]|nr:hypothetical protein [Lachnospiraceae bacterium]
MTPVAKFNSIIVAVTTAIMYFLWIFINKISPDFIENNGLVANVIAILSSLGFYRLLTSILKGMFEKMRFVRKMLLGDRYLEGTWVGFYISEMKEVRYLYETYEQSLDDVLICGHSYKEDKTMHGKWTALNPLIDCKKKSIKYYYETDMAKKTHIGQGFASFSLEKTDGKKYFNIMQGFSSDLNQTEKSMAFEMKVSEELWSDPKKILEKAEEVYHNNKEYFS